MFESVRKIILCPVRHCNLNNCVIAGVLLFLSAEPLLNAQTNTDTGQADFDQLYEFVLDKYGMDQVLVNGVVYSDIYWKKQGHQFLGEDRPYSGKLFFRGKEYEGLEMKYDICNQQLIVFLRTSSLQQGIIPPHDFISAFTLDGRSFSKMDFGGEPRYYQVVFDSDNLKCLYHWSKETMETAGSENYKYFHYEFSADKKKSYLFLNGSFGPYKRNSSFIDLFPEDIRPAIRQFIKANRIQVSRCSDERMIELMSYCNTLFRKADTPQQLTGYVD